MNDADLTGKKIEKRDPPSVRGGVGGKRTLVSLSFDRRNHHHSERKGWCHHATLPVWSRSTGRLHRWAIQGPFPSLLILAGGTKAITAQPTAQQLFFWQFVTSLCISWALEGGNRLTTRMIASMATADNNGAPPPRLSFFLSCPLTASPAFFCSFRSSLLPISPHKNLGQKSNPW